jgi:signal transduction histidine kinase
MNGQRSLLRNYQAGLQKHLQEGTMSHFAAAQQYGQRAVAMGLETLEFARLHEHAFAALKLSGSKEGVLKRAQLFFNEAVTPIVETHRAARQSKASLDRLQGTLSRRTAELTLTSQRLRKAIIARGDAEIIFKDTGRHQAGLLKESLHIQRGLRKLTHKLLTAQEDERRGISRELREEIAQTLLAINVRLVLLKKDARLRSKNLKSEISSTQRLVRISATSMRRAARQFRKA